MEWIGRRGRGDRKRGFCCGPLLLPFTLLLPLRSVRRRKGRWEGTPRRSYAPSSSSSSFPTSPLLSFLFPHSSVASNTFTVGRSEIFGQSEAPPLHRPTTITSSALPDGALVVGTTTDAVRKPTSSLTAEQMTSVNI